MKLLSTILLSCMYMSGIAQSNTEDNTMPFVYHGHIYLPTTINDSVKLNTLFDTGAANVFGVDSVALKQSNWNPKKKGKAKAGGAAGATMVKIIVDGTSVKMGNVEQQYQMVPIFKLRDIIDCHVDGITGIKDISRCPFEINFEKHYLKQYISGKANTEGYMELPIKYENNRINLEAEVQVGGKKIQGWFLMDTGSGSTFSFTSKAMKDFGIDKIDGKRLYLDIANLGIGDKTKETIVEMMSDYILIGSDTIRYTEIEYTPDGVGAFGDRPYLGIIGNGVWEKFNIIIDAKAQKLYLRRHQADKPLDKKYGYSWQNRTDICQGWIVRGLYRNSAASDAGLEIGDTIISINGRDVKNYSWDEEDGLSKFPRQELNVISANGKHKHITLEAKEYW